MAIMAMDMRKNKLSKLILISLLGSSSTFAGELVFTPSLIIDETYTDNVELSLSDEISSLVSQTGVAIETSYTAKKINFNLSTQSLFAAYSHDHELDDDFHTVASDITIELWPKGLSLIGGINIDRRARNQTRNALADIVSGDTIKIESYIGGLQYNISNSHMILSSYISYIDKQSEDNIGNREGYVTAFNSQNGQGNHNIFWDIESNYQEIKNNERSSRMYSGEIKLGLITSFKFNPFLRYFDEENNGNIGGNQALESNSYGAGIRWLITPRLALDISYNKPIGNTLDTHGDEQKEYISSSINWQPTERTQLSASISQRFYGDSYSFSFTHKNKRFTNSISYVEDVQTLTRNNYIPFDVGSYWCPNQDRLLVSECYVVGDTNINFDNYELITIRDFTIEEDDQYSLNKTLSWNSTLALARTTFTLNILGSTRENLSTIQQDENARADFRISRKVSSKSTINLNLSYTDNTFQKDTEDERRDRYRQYQINFEKSLNSKLALDFSLGLVNRDSNDTLFNYEESRVTFKITKDF
jgi:uncharacterized protein (PEP-CTERM system associated)